MTSVSRAIFIPGDTDDSERRVIFTGTGRYSGGLWEGSLVGVEETKVQEAIHIIMLLYIYVYNS